MQRLLVTEVRTVTDYVEDFEEGTNGADFSGLAAMPTAGTIFVTNSGASEGTSEAIYSNEQVHSGTLALKLRNAAFNWSDAQETGNWPSASLSMWLRGHFTGEVTSWSGEGHLVLAVINAAVDSIIIMDAMLNSGLVTLNATSYDGTLTQVDTNSASANVNPNTWFQLAVVAEDGFAQAKLVDANENVLASAALPWSQTIAMVTALTVQAGAGGAAEITYVDDIVLTLADVVVAVASDDMGGVRQSFLRGR